MSQKYCPKCKVEKDIAEFGPNKSRKDGLQSHCKQCRNDYLKSWYKENSDLHKSRVKTSKDKDRAEKRLKIQNFLREHPCIDCGNEDIEVLEFDHRDATTKEFAVADYLRQGANWQRIFAEMEKCDVRCANCHRKKTRRQLGWWIKENDLNTDGQNDSSL